jgi:transcriptional regulator with XRE-family HTH domain
MLLSLNIKQYRLDHFLSQEYVADKLNTTQSNYSRIEKSETACAKRLIQIANAMGTTPEILTNYHLTQDENGKLTPAEWVINELKRKQEENKHQQETIKIQDTYIQYVRAVITDYGLTSGKPLDELPTVVEEVK